MSLFTTCSSTFTENWHQESIGEVAVVIRRSLKQKKKKERRKRKERVIAG